MKEATAMNDPRSPSRFTGISLGTKVVQGQGSRGKGAHSRWKKSKAKACQISRQWLELLVDTAKADGLAPATSIENTSRTASCGTIVLHSKL